MHEKYGRQRFSIICSVILLNICGNCMLQLPAPLYLRTTVIVTGGNGQYNVSTKMLLWNPRHCREPLHEAAGCVAGSSGKKMARSWVITYVHMAVL